MDQTQSGRVLAEAVEEAYADLFQIRRDAQNMDRGELKGKIKTLTQGQVSDAVVDKMGMTFLAVCHRSAPRGPLSATASSSSQGVLPLEIGCRHDDVSVATEP